MVLQTRTLSYVVAPPVNCRQQGWMRVFTCEGDGGKQEEERRRQGIHIVHAVPPFSLCYSQHLDLQQKTGGKRGPWPR